jgi:hypothetical protein
MELSNKLLIGYSLSQEYAMDQQTGVQEINSTN